MTNPNTIGDQLRAATNYALPMATILCQPILTSDRPHFANLLVFVRQTLERIDDEWYVAVYSLAGSSKTYHVTVEPVAETHR